jgi:hypothetical protein
MLARIRDWHQNLSWGAGYHQGQRKRPFRCPWWADRQTFGLAYMQGMTGEPLITKDTLEAEEKRAAEAKDLLDKLRGL